MKMEKKVYEAYPVPLVNQEIRAKQVQSAYPVHTGNLVILDLVGSMVAMDTGVGPDHEEYPVIKGKWEYP